MLYPNSSFTNLNHKAVIFLIGCGGTGSRILIELSALSQNLVEMDHLGFEIHVFDDDIVEQHNIGRQMFYQSDLHEFKSEVLASRINRSYGDTIISYNRKIGLTDVRKHKPMFIISAVDNVSTRKEIKRWIDSLLFNNYWIDTGNGKNSGQVVMSILQDGKKITPSCVDLFPKMKDDREEVSCSTRAALSKQSFTINKFIANFTIQFLTNIFIDYQIPYTQLYFNSNPFKIKTK